MTPVTSYDLITMGRSSIDLYANDVGVPFVDIESFAAIVGGSSTNISVSIRRLGLKVALHIEIGQDPIGEFILTIKGWDWYKSARMGNACGTIIVTRHGCANHMGYEDEVLQFIDERGGF